jgi:hypothetical protein
MSFLALPQKNSRKSASFFCRFFSAAVFFSAAIYLAGCGVYTFSGSTLPNYLKTVEVPQFANQSLHPEVAEALTGRINKEVLTSNLLRIVSSGGDATINGKVISYNHHPYTYGSQSYRDVTVTQYSVSIRVEVEFMDNVKNEPLFKGPLSADGIYDLNGETEQTGMDRALDKIVELIIQNSVRNW